MPWSVGTSGFDPCTRFCDVSIQAAQLRSVLGVHTGFTSQMVPKRRYPQICKNKQKIDSAIYI
nr:MAG TPA: hypothetical protein [Caudoviricetes sp.]